MTSKIMSDVPSLNSNVIIISPVPSEPVYCCCVNLTLILDESIITPVAVVSEPATIPGVSDGGISKFILKVSSPSTMLSLLNGILTVMLVAPAGIVATTALVLKSSPSIRLL